MRGRTIFVAALGLLVAVGSLFAQVTPPAPTNLQEQLEPYGLRLPGVMLTWQVPFRADINFKVYRSVADSMHFHAIGTTGWQMYHDFNVSAGNKYYYYVTSIVFHHDSSWESSRSNIVNVTVAGTATPKGIISGTVSDSSTGLPIHGVKDSVLPHRRFCIFGEPVAVGRFAGAYRFPGSLRSEARYWQVLD